MSIAAHEGSLPRPLFHTNQEGPVHCVHRNAQGKVVEEFEFKSLKRAAAFLERNVLPINRSFYECYDAHGTSVNPLWCLV